MFWSYAHTRGTECAPRQTLRPAHRVPQANSVDAWGLPAMKLTAVYTPADNNLSGVDFSMFFAQMQAARSYTGARGVGFRVLAPLPLPRCAELNKRAHCMAELA